MKYNINNSELQKIYTLLNKDEDNRMMSDFIIDIIENGKEIGSLALNENIDLFKAICNYYKVDRTFIKHLNEVEFKKSITLLNVEDYNNNPYYKNVHLESIKDNNISIEYVSFNAYQPILCDNITVDRNHIEHTCIGYFNEDIKYPQIKEDGSVWMLITPHEIKTMEKPIKEATGNVLVFGLGLGYFPYMISIKDNVNKITIVEKDKKIIKMFKEHILPFFEHKEKITIIEDNAKNFIENDFDYNYCFVDLWFDTLDGLPLYIYFKNKEKKHPNTKFDYWIEDSMLIMLSRLFYTILYNDLNGIKMPYDVINDEYDIIANKMYNKLKDIEITQYKDVEKLLTIESLINSILD